MLWCDAHPDTLACNSVCGRSPIRWNMGRASLLFNITSTVYICTMLQQIHHNTSMHSAAWSQTHGMCAFPDAHGKERVTVPYRTSDRLHQICLESSLLTLNMVAAESQAYLAKDCSTLHCQALGVPGCTAKGQPCSSTMHACLDDAGRQKERPMYRQVATKPTVALTKWCFPATS